MSRLSGCVSRPARCYICCHIVGYRVYANDRAVRVANRCDAERDWEHRSVLSDPYGLKVLDTLAGLDLGQDGADLSGSILGTEHLDGLADDLLAGVAIHPLGAWVPTRDDAFERLADDRLIRIRDDRRHALGVFERSLPICYLMRRGDHQQNVPGVDHGQTDIDRETRAIPSPSSQLQIQSHGPAQRIGKVVLPVFGIDLPEVLRHQSLNGLADQVVAVMAEQRLRLIIDEPDHARLVYPHQGIRLNLRHVLRHRHVRRHLIPLPPVADISKLAEDAQILTSNLVESRIDMCSRFGKPG